MRHVHLTGPGILPPVSAVAAPRLAGRRCTSARLLELHSWDHRTPEDGSCGWPKSCLRLFRAGAEEQLRSRPMVVFLSPTISKSMHVRFEDLTDQLRVFLAERARRGAASSASNCGALTSMISGIWRSHDHNAQCVSETRSIE